MSPDLVANALQNLSSEIAGLRKDIREDNKILHSKIDTNKDAVAAQFTELIKNGCAQGALDRKDIINLGVKVATLEDRPDKQLARIAVIVSILAAAGTVLFGILKLNV